MPLREIDLDTPIQVTRTKKRMRAITIRKDDGVPIIKAEWVVPNDRGREDIISVRVSDAVAADWLGRPGVDAFVDAVRDDTK